MLIMSKKSEYFAETKVLESIVDDLNKKFDPHDLIHFSADSGEKMFKGNYHTCGKSAESWEITFFGHKVFSGGKTNEMSECQEEDYITLEEKNRQKIFMIAVSNTILVIKNMVTFFAYADVSEKNKNEWISILKKGIEDAAE